MKRQQAGFSMLETMLALSILVVVGGIVTTGMFQLMKTQNSIANRTDMHTSVRSATELLEQEIGQAGRASLAAPGVNVTMAAVGTGSQNITLTPSTAALYPNEYLTVGAGPTQETVQVAGTVAAPTANFVFAHGSATTPVMLLGAFSTGVVPPDNTTNVVGGCAPTTYTPVAPFDTSGSNCTTLKLYGDINGDGTVVYVEYTCSQGTASAPGFLYRQQVPYGGAKVAVTSSMILLNNVLANPNDANNNVVPCFRYQTQPLGTGWVVTNVAVTLTVQTQNIDPVTHNNQTETKALLNVSPRNVYEVFDTAKLVDPTRALQMPAWIQALL